MTKVHLSLIVFISVLSCTSNESSKGINPTIVIKKDSLKEEERGKGDTILKLVRDMVNDEEFTILYTKSWALYVLSSKGDSINIDEQTGIHDMEFQDFNGDGYKDIRIYYMTNVPGVENLLLYNKEIGSFTEVENIDDFGSPIRIGNRNLYYSYYRNGCADKNWRSDLFYIKDYKALRTGTIFGYECGDSGIKDGIYIYKIIDNSEKFVKRESIERIKEYKDYKWGYIEEFWKRNFNQFLNP